MYKIYWKNFMRLPRYIPKIWRIMKLTTIFLLCTFLQLSAKSSFSQTITLKHSNINLADVFKEIRKQTGYNVLWSPKHVNKELKVNTNFTNTSLDEALVKTLNQVNLTFTIEDKNIVITPKERPTNNTPASRVIVTGRVTDEKGNPLSGVSVKIKGSTQGTATTADGKFSISESSENMTLIFSYMGFTTLEIAVGTGTEINVILKEASKSLNEITVIGYGTQKKSDVTGSISTFKPTEQNSRPVLGPEQMLQGRVAGVNISSGSGTPGGQNRVSIRGIGSLTANNEPLYVIDGIPVVKQNAALINMGENMGVLAQLNPNDIESVEVLKDAAAAAIYGSRATNGVIIITTKTGKKGVSSFHIDYTQGIQDIPKANRLKMASSDLYLEVVNEGIDNYNTQFGYTPGMANYMEHKYNPYQSLPDTDWFDLVTRTAGYKNLNASASSGTDKTDFFFSAGYTDQEGIIKSSRMQKFNSKLNVGHKVTDWMKISSNSNLSYSKNNRVPGSNLGSTVFGRAIPQRPFDRVYKPNGDYYIGGTEDLLYHNPIQILDEADVKLNNYRYLGNISSDINIAKGLVFKTMLGVDALYTVDFQHYLDTHPYGVGIGKISDGRRLSTNLINENFFTYNNSFKSIDYSLLLGQSFQKTTTSASSIDGQGFPSSSYKELSVAAEIANASTSNSDNTLMSYFFRSNFSHQGKYLLSLSLRADGSSKFSPENRWGYFPSVSAGWNIVKEDFWNLPAINQLKLRTSYGATGNQDGISSYAYQALMSGGKNYNNQSGIGNTAAGNRDLTWETAQQFDAGLDIAILQGKMSFTVDYFIKNTNNLLYSKPLHGTTGFSSIISNIGSMRNNGIEFTIHGDTNFGKLNWSSDFNISSVKNKLTSLLGDEPIFDNNRVLKVGEEIGSFYLYKMLGVYQKDSDVPASLYTNNNIRAGDIIIEDVDGNGIIDVNDRQIIGSSNPKFYGGWNNTFRYGQFDLTMFLTFSLGSDVFKSAEMQQIERIGGLFNILEGAAYNRWTSEGSTNEYPRAIYGSTWNHQNTTRFLHDGSFIRLRSLMLGYTLPSAALSKLKIKDLRLYIQADNLALFTKYPGMDPEVSSGFDPRYFGVDNMILPQPRIINFGLNLKI
ncbi:TonB-dependent receptor [Sphingobacterium paucimobilis]|uniref:Secretin/TonB short N-terminal domain-containing protein n=1 Tax=Sphingobacterium paucimobilis HER1398 TaxID=1346330 RepID=U2HY26_9SPHI|nr:TonB-dependent receptor [Sphingobacterium paucimobilis]ERJ60462.1 hypothetical protein M472_17050 [Sphingobacterium paucimobilis HER1398]